MLFNSHVFIFLFLPLAVIGYYVLRSLSAGDRMPVLWLLGMSLFFYGWWEPRYLLLLGTSMGVNYLLGRQMVASESRKSWLKLGIVFNLGLLAYFKYTGFLLTSVSWFATLSFEIPDIVLPLAISFFTFQQIAWLVDLSRDEARLPPFINYALFVSFFPQLIAGPIVHHSEMMPQFERQQDRSKLNTNIAVGLTLFSMGLFKKVVLADQFALWASPVFFAAETGEIVTTLEAWVGLLSYTFQLYFDFSGYSDMALGLARLFGIVLPLNFYSPYKARNIEELWRRWHMTLSRFLRIYLYIPLGGNRRGFVTVNIMITMLLGGLWHGAAWTFVVWGGMQGVFLLAHRGFRRTGIALPHVLCVLITFTCFVLTLVPFRAESFNAAMNMYRAMFGEGGWVLPANLGGQALPYLQGKVELTWLFIGGVICFGMPNAAQLMGNHGAALIPKGINAKESRLQWSPSIRWSVAVGIMFSCAVLSLFRISEFLYFQF